MLQTALINPAYAKGWAERRARKLAGVLPQKAEIPDSAGRRPYVVAGSVAVIPVWGSLYHAGAGGGLLGDWEACFGASYESLFARITMAMDDTAVEGILLHVDSPGGDACGAFDLADRIREARSTKPVWALADEKAFSAAYALASQADRLILPRTASVGSIGVVTAHIDLSGSLERSGVAITYIYSGSHKVDGNPHQPLPDAVRARVQSDVDALRAMFCTTVATGRGISTDAVMATEAETYMGADAITAGLADTIMPAADVLPAFFGYLAGQSDPVPSHTAKGASAMGIFAKVGKKTVRLSDDKDTPEAETEDDEKELDGDEDPDRHLEDEENDTDTDAEGDDEDKDLEDGDDDPDMEDVDEDKPAARRARVKVRQLLNMPCARVNMALAVELATDRGMTRPKFRRLMSKAGSDTGGRRSLSSRMPKNAAVGLDGASRKASPDDQAVASLLAHSRYAPKR